MQEYKRVYWQQSPPNLHPQKYSKCGAQQVPLFRFGLVSEILKFHLNFHNRTDDCRLTRSMWTLRSKQSSHHILLPQPCNRFPWSNLHVLDGVLPWVNELGTKSIHTCRWSHCERDFRAHCSPKCTLLHLRLPIPHASNRCPHPLLLAPPFLSLVTSCWVSCGRVFSLSQWGKSCCAQICVSQIVSAHLGCLREEFRAWEFTRLSIAGLDDSEIRGRINSRKSQNGLHRSFRHILV